MENSIGVGFMAVFAVSGSVVLLAHQVHKRLLSHFMKNIECELGGLLCKSHDHHHHHHHHPKKLCGSEKTQSKKSVRFADDVVEPSSNNKEYRKKRLTKQARDGQVVMTMEGTVPNLQGHASKLEDTMPLNRQALYKGIIEFKALKAHVY